VNYQHAFHAGNFADVHKHCVLARILVHLRQKPAAFRVLDTHAGAGRYDLLAAEASRGGEWHDGIERVWKEAERGGFGHAAQTLLAPYLEVVAAANPGGNLRIYPGSPVIVQKLLRTQDRLIGCELAPGPAASLASVLRGDRRAKAIPLDGWTAIGAYVPPKERRGLVFVDPPFEDAADFSRLAEALRLAHRKWPSGIYLLWYPIKTRAAPDALARRLQEFGIAKILRCELAIALPQAESRLAGSGLIVVNPPFTLEQDLRVLLPALGGVLTRGTAKTAPRIDRLGL
jgi:23S rRNA (adenine2030-N6)-methyltransferase